jgi:transposase
MPKLLRVRELTAEEAEAIKRLAHSRASAARLVERARIVWLSSQGWRVPAIAAEVGCGADVVRLWLKRFDATGLAGLADAPRAGRPATYTATEVGTVVATALSDPRALGCAFGCWTYARLEAYLNEVVSLAIKRSRINEVLLAEGLRWREQETWFGARVDPDFAAKRGRSRPSTPPRPRTA